VPTDAGLAFDELAIYLTLPGRTLDTLARKGSMAGHKVRSALAVPASEHRLALDHGQPLP
jgi:hypothetical protein